MSETKCVFLSTPSSQRATSGGLLIIRAVEHFYPRPLRRGRPSIVQPSSCAILDFYPRPLRRGRRARGSAGRAAIQISIHALFAEGDDGNQKNKNARIRFLSTPSSQRATTVPTGALTRAAHFYPRPLRRGRRSRRGVAPTG